MKANPRLCCLRSSVVLGLIVTSSTVALGQDDTQRMQELMGQLSPAVVKIEVNGTAPNGQVDKRRGTGFIVSSSGMFTFIVTAGHVLGSNEKEDQTRNKDWQVQNGKIVNRKVQVFFPDGQGSLVEKKVDVVPIDIAVPGTDLALFSINGTGYTSLSLGDAADTDQPRKVLLLGYKAESWGLTKPAVMGMGQNTTPLRYRTEKESSRGESGGPWIDLKSGKVLAVASKTETESSDSSFDSTPITLIKSTLGPLQPAVHQADRDKATYEKAQGHLELLQDYVKSCLLDCAYKAAAQAEISSIQQASHQQAQISEQARQQDQTKYAAARGDISKLQIYVASCASSPCEYKSAANAEITSIARQSCDRTFATPLDLDVPKSTPPMRDTASLTDEDLKSGLSSCLIMQKVSDERRYLTQAGRGYATIANRSAAAGDPAKASEMMAKGVDSWQDAAKAGSGAAMNFLGAYYNGTFNTGKLAYVKQDPQKATEFWVNGAIAKNAKAMENAGIVFLAGPSDYPPIQRDVDKARQLLASAFEGGSTYAATVLGKALFYGSPSELKRDTKTGLDYLTKACIAGDLPARRFFDLEMSRSQNKPFLPDVRPAGCLPETTPSTSVSQVISQQPSTSTASYWDFKNSSGQSSILQLDADGSSRKFYYYSPRPELQAVGVKRGTLAFDGKRTDNKYTGNAFVFSKTCGPLAYPVTGTVSADQRKVQFSGAVPKRGAGCTVASYTNDTWEYDLRSSGIN
jgi:hypothetical protein